jgi:hypothetical protein
MRDRFRQLIGSNIIYVTSQCICLMQCPNCNVNFHPQMFAAPIGQNKDNRTLAVYYQICPSCKEAIVGVKTLKPYQSLPISYDTEDLSLLHK